MKRFFIANMVLLLWLPGFGQQIDIRILKAKVLLEQSQNDAGIDLLLPIKPNSIIYTLLGRAYYQKSDLRNAIKYYLIADSLQKNSTCFDLARSYARQNDLKKALFWLQNYLVMNDKRSELEIRKEPAFAEYLATKEWNALWEKNWYSESEVEKNAINAMIARGNLVSAQNELDRWKDRIYPKHVTFALQAKIYEKQKMLDLAISYVNQAIEQGSRMDSYFALRGQLLFKLARYHAAEEDASRAIKLNFYQPSYYLLRIESARMAGNLELAEADLKLYGQLYPDSAETIHQLGLLENAKGHYHNAVDFYDQLLQINKRNAQFYMERGQNKAALRDNEGADEDYGMALDLDPTLMDAFLKRGQAELTLGDTKGACHCLKRAKQMGSKEAATLLYNNCKD